MAKINLDKFKMGYFILWKNQGGVVGDLIEKHQKKIGFSSKASKYTHIDVSGGGPFVVCVAPPKIEVVSFLERYPEGVEFLVVKLKDRKYRGRKSAKVAFWASSNCNRKYDWFGVVKFKISWIFHKLQQFFCSENALWALQKEFPTAMDGLEPHKCMPAHFFDSEDFREVYSGKL